MLSVGMCHRYSWGEEAESKPAISKCANTDSIFSWTGRN